MPIILKRHKHKPNRDFLKDSNQVFSFQSYLKLKREIKQGTNDKEQMTSTMYGPYYDAIGVLEHKRKLLIYIVHHCVVARRC
jgi:hypothetical protein